MVEPLLAELLRGDLDAMLLEGVEGDKLQIEVIIEGRLGRYRVVEGQAQRAGLALVRAAQRPADALAEPAAIDLAAIGVAAEFAHAKGLRGAIRRGGVRTRWPWP